jgi:hypothetical protein
MTKTLRITIAAAADRCFARFCAAEDIPRWVAGITRAEIVRRDTQGLPAEVRFELSAPSGVTRRYSLLYAYDVGRRRVAWMPGDGADQAVRGFAVFDDRGDRCEMGYALELMNGELDAQKEALAQARDVLAAFKRFVELG